MIKKLILLVALIYLSSSFPAWSAYRYVDNGTKEADVTWSGVNGESYASSHASFPGNGYGYNTIQAAVTAMATGDKIYIRGGTYQENVDLPISKNGSSWEEGNYNYIGSFPTEWAVIDGQHAQYYTLGHHDTGSLGDHDIKYWKIERLEITGGTQSDRGGGFCGNGGPFIVRYCYFHDNICSSNSENPGGIRGYCWRDSIIEYNYFYNNGSTTNSDNGGDIMIFADYRYISPATYFNTGAYEGYYYARNEIRYNYFAGGVNGIKQKSQQQMTGSFNSPDYSLPSAYQTWGDKVHHNIFENYAYAGMQIWQDFAQVHNNILYNSTIDVQGYSSTVNAPTTYVTIYNNTMLRYPIRDWKSQPTTTFTPRVNILNNVFDYVNYFRDSNYDGIILIGFTGVAGAETNIELSAGLGNIDYNYLYRPITQHFKIGCVDGEERTTASFNSYYTKTNYAKASSEGSDNLFVGSSGAYAYTTRGAHIITGSTMIANAGIGGNHPYLDGVALPSYLGATNPSQDSGLDWSPTTQDGDDAGWVDYVLSLAEIVTLTNGDTADSNTTPDSSNDNSSDSGGGGGGCFIATAAYGSAFESHVEILRQFRDVYLMTTTLGREFVNIYYKYSPALAGVIAKHNSMRAMVRWTLTPLVGISYVALHTSLEQKIIIALLIMLLLATSYIIAKKRMRKKLL